MQLRIRFGLALKVQYRIPHVVQVDLRTAAQDPVVSHFVQAARQYVLQEPTQEFEHRQRHLSLASLSMTLFSTTSVRECDVVV